MPAMPLISRRHIDAVFNNNESAIAGMGMTKREYFICMAMQGMLAGGHYRNDSLRMIKDLPAEAVAIAESTLHELERTK